MMDQTRMQALAAEAADSETSAERLREISLIPEMQALVAANPATPVDTLEALCALGSKDLLRQLTGNPNTPESILLQMVEQFPHEFLTNPILPLWQLIQPDFLKKFSHAVWLTLLDCPECPAHWQQWLRQEAQRQFEQFELHLQNNPRETVIFLPLLLTNPSLVIRKRALLTPSQKRLLVKYHRELEPEVLHELAQTRDIKLQCSIAYHPRTLVETLEVLATGDPLVRKAVAGNRLTPLRLLSQLAEDNEVMVRVAVAHHREAELALLCRLAKDTEAQVRAAVALHYQLDEALIWQLSSDPIAEVRAALAINLHIPEDVLALLAYDSEACVRKQTARNPRLPFELFSLLSKDESEDVIQKLASNAQLPQNLSWQFASHPSPEVRAQVARNPRAPQPVLAQLLADSDYTVLSGIAHNPQATVEMLTRLAQDKHEHVRMATLANKRLPRHLLLELAERRPTHNPLYIMQGLITNPHTPLELLIRLIEVHGQAFLVGIANHPAVLRNRRQVIQDYLFKFLLESASKKYNRSSLRLSLLEEMSTVPEIQESFAQSSYWEERYMLARREQALPALLEKLANDHVPYVRIAARTTLAGRL